MGNFHESKGKIPYKGKNDTFKEKIMAYKKLLAEYNITFNDLTNYNPKDPEIRKYLLKIAKLIVKMKI